MKTNRFRPLRAFAAKSPFTLICLLSARSALTVFVFFLAMLVAAANAPSASAQAVTYAGSGAVNFGSANLCPAGKAAPAPCGQTLALTYKVTESGTLGTPRALALGAPNLDYKLAGGTTCSGSVAKGATCEVKIAFAPTAIGARNGAVEIVDASGNVLATTLVYGTGVGPAIGFNPPAQIGLGGGNALPYGDLPTVDGSGNYFTSACAQTCVVEELLAVDGVVPANPVVKVLAPIDGYQAYVAAMALDGAGNLFVAVAYGYYYNNGYVEELLAAGGYAQSVTLGGNFSFVTPTGLALDGSGNVFLATSNYPDEVGIWQGALYEIPAAGGYATVNTLGGSSRFLPYNGIALDAAGNLFAASSSYDGGSVLKLSPADHYSTAKVLNVNYEGYGPSAIALDPAGDLFALYTYANTLKEYLAVNGVLPASPASRDYGSFNSLYSLLSDGGGGLFVFDQNGAHDLRMSAPSSTPLAFALTSIGQTSYDSPQSVQIQNQGNAALDLSALSVSPNWTLVKGPGTPKDCAATASLASSALCDISIDFDPTETGPLAGAVTLADNSFNIPGSQQSIPLGGAGTDAPTPHISSLNAVAAAPYSVVVVNGTGFEAKQGSSTVAFNGIPTPHYHWSNNQIYVTVPPNVAIGQYSNVVVTVGGQASNPSSIYIAPQPVVTGISPASGVAGTVVTINGGNLLPYASYATVSSNGKPLEVLSATSNAIQVLIPAGVVTGPFHVLVNDTGMNTPVFTVVPPPSIAGFSPTSGPVGTIVTISGKGLFYRNSNTTVSFDGIALPIRSATSAAITVAVPDVPESTYAPFLVEVNGSGRATGAFNVTK